MGLNLNLGLDPEFSAQLEQVRLVGMNVGRMFNGLPPLTELPPPSAPALTANPSPPEVLGGAVLPVPIPAPRPAKKPESGNDRFHAKHDERIFEIIRAGEYSGRAGKGWCSIARIILREKGFIPEGPRASRSNKVVGASYGAAERGLLEYIKKNAEYFGL